MRSTDEAPRALHEEVTDRIRRAILTGSLAPGTRLVEDRLAHEYEVSRHPVREALRTLQLEGLVEIAPRKGATVVSTSPDEVVELMEMLTALDGLAARLAATRQEGASIGELETLLDGAADVLRQSPGGGDSGDLDRLAQMNRRFHALVVAAGGNVHLIETIGPLRDRIQWSLAAVASLRPETSWAEHKKVFEAIRDRDSERAERLARGHIYRAKVAYLAYTSRFRHTNAT